MPDALHSAVESLSANVDRIVDTVDGLIPAMNRLSESSERLAKRNRSWRAIVIALVVLIVGGIGIVWQVQRQSSCFSKWANASTSRSNILGPLNVLVLTDLGLVLDDTFMIPPNQKQTLKDARQLDSDLHAYTAASLAHPVPESPRYTCSVFTP
jgi:hypothetical protein